MQPTLSWMSSDGSLFELNSLARTLDVALDMIIFDTDVASLALPFIGNGRPHAVTVTAPFLIKQTFSFLKIPQAPQFMKVLPGSYMCASSRVLYCSHCAHAVRLPMKGPWLLGYCACKLYL